MYTGKWTADNGPTHVHVKHTSTLLPTAAIHTTVKKPSLSAKLCECAFKKRSSELKSHPHVHRGYKPSFVQDQIGQASHIRREDALTPRTRTSCNKRIPLVITYHPMQPPQLYCPDEEYPSSTTCLRPPEKSHPLTAPG